MENNKEIWTEVMVASAFEEAMRILKKLPAENIHWYSSNWPQVIYKEIELLRMDQKPKKWAVPPRQISKMEMIFSWIGFVEDVKARKIIFARANKIPWKFICAEFVLSRTAINAKWKQGIVRICQKLNEEQ